jgi:hypothetical protein
MAQANGQASANLVSGQAHGQISYGPKGAHLSTQGQANASVGATAQGQAFVGFDPKHGTVGAGANGSVFAGAQAGGTVTQTAGPASASATGQVEAGIGAQFQADVGMHNGKLGVKLDVGAALGIGANVGVNFNVDAGQAVHDVEHVGHDVKEGAKKAWHALTGWL